MSADLDARSQALLGLLLVAGENDCTVSRVKAAKLLYLADLEAIRSGTGAVSGCTWRWDDHGPFDRSLYEAERRLATAGFGNTVERNTWSGATEFRLQASPAARNPLSEEVLSVLRLVVRRWGKLPAKKLADLTYETPPMQHVQKEGRRGDLLEMAHSGQRAGASQALKRLAGVRSRSVRQPRDAEAAEGLRREIASTADLRAQATKTLLD